MAEYVTLDSGEREEYDSGMRRDSQAGKPRYDLIDRAFLRRWAELMARGAQKYGDDNWRLADSEQELKRFKASALRHLFQWLEGDQTSETEDHAVGAVFNIAAAEFVANKLAAKQSVTEAGSRDICSHNAAAYERDYDDFLNLRGQYAPPSNESLRYDKGRWLVHGVSMNDEQYTTFVAAQAKARATVSSDEVINNEGRW